MNQLYQQADLSKQAHAHWLSHQHQRGIDAERIIAEIIEQRRIHPRMGLRKLHQLCHQQPNAAVGGRDRFIAIATEAGLCLPRAINRQRTTYGLDSEYPNRLVGRTLTDVNQVWVSDITYYHVGRRFSYITLLMDLYSRKIVAATAADTLQACWSVEVVEQAVRQRRIDATSGLIHHSDRGSQYLSGAYLKVLAGAGVEVSTCQIVYENAHAERVNGIIKQEYLDCWLIDSEATLLSSLSVAVERYNTSRPHGSLGGMSPVDFERLLEATPIDQHPPMPIWPQQPLLRLTQGINVPYIVS